jgi:hypothetical protein
MNNQNLHFDIDRRKIGMALSTCQFGELVQSTSVGDVADENVNKLFNRKTERKKTPPTLKPIVISKINVVNDTSESALIHGCVDKDERPLELCSAICFGVSTAKVVHGTQKWTSKCISTSSMKACSVVCENDSRMSGTDPTCFDGPWSTCSAKCEQSRTVGSKSKGGTCAKSTEQRVCYQGLCNKDSDVYLSVDLLFTIGNVQKVHWSYEFSEDVERAASKLLDIPGYAVKLDTTNITSLDASGITFKINARVPPSKSSIEKIKLAVFGESSKSTLLSELYLSKGINWKFLTPNLLHLELNRIVRGKNVTDLSVKEIGNIVGPENQGNHLIYISFTVGGLLSALVIVLLFRHLRGLIGLDAYTPRGSKTAHPSNRFKKVTGKR